MNQLHESTMNQQFKLLRSALIIFLLATQFIALHAQERSQYVQLTTLWHGKQKALEVINNGYNNRLRLADAANVSNQYWRLKNLGNGHFRIMNLMMGEENSIDLIEEKGNFVPQIAKTGNFSAQNWKITRVEKDGKLYFSLSTMWKGENQVLDLIRKDGQNHLPRLAQNNGSSGQLWSLGIYTMEEFNSVEYVEPKKLKEKTPIGKKYEKEITQGMKEVQKFLDKNKKKKKN